MKGYVDNLEQKALKNGEFRKVLYTGNHSQLVLMSVKPGDQLGEEVHEGNDQFFRFESGDGKVVIDGVEHRVKDGSGVVVPAGARHNVINTSRKADLRLYTIYSPPHHKDGILRRTKAEAEANEEEYDGRASE